MNCVKCGRVLPTGYTFIRCQSCRVRPMTADEVREEIWARQQTFKRAYEVDDFIRGKV